MRWAAVCLVALLAPWAAAQRSPFTGLQVPPVADDGSYRLVFSGHFHGASNNRSGYPAATLLANIDTLNALAPHALLSTGDLFLNVAADSSRYRRSLFSRLHLPLFNAVGNHDVEDGHYAQRYGPLYGAVELGADRVLWLDTESDNGSIKGDQLRFMRESIAAFAGRRLFLVSHRPVWAEDDPVYSELFAGNTRSMLATNYRSEVLPLLEDLAQRAEVIWVSGSMAGLAPESIFFQRHAPGILFVQSAIRDLPRDAVLVVDAKPDTLLWSTLSLTGRPVPAVETLDADFWRSRMRKKEPFNVRLLPYLARKAVERAEFWYGVVATLIFGGALSWGLRKFRTLRSSRP